MSPTSRRPQHHIAMPAAQILPAGITRSMFRDSRAGALDLELDAIPEQVHSLVDHLWIMHGVHTYGGERHLTVLLCHHEAAHGLEPWPTLGVTYTEYFYLHHHKDPDPSDDVWDWGEPETSEWTW